MTAVCQTCRYVDVVIVDDTDPTSICRRHPPTGGEWPVVFDDDWCGEHEPEETL